MDPVTLLTAVSLEQLGGMDEWKTPPPRLIWAIPKLWDVISDTAVSPRELGVLGEVGESKRSSRHISQPAFQKVPPCSNEEVALRHQLPLF